MKSHVMWYHLEGMPNGPMPQTRFIRALLLMNEHPATYLTILTKNNIFSFLGLVRAEMLNNDIKSRPISAVVKHDPREGQPLLKHFDTRSEAIRKYEEAISTSIERGWSVVYRGAPLFG